MRLSAFGLVGLLVACGGNLEVGHDTGSGGNGGGELAEGGKTMHAGGFISASGEGSGATKATGGAGSAMGGGATKATGGAGSTIEGGNGPTLATGGKNGGGTLAKGGAVGAGGGDSLPAWPSSECGAVIEVPATGTWEGYTEDFLFRPVDKYRVVLAGVNEHNVLCGSVTYGDGDPLPPATDPDAAYPPGRADGKPGPYEPYSGTTYTILDGAQRDAIVRFQISLSQPMDSWCQLQQPFFQAESQSYQCLPAAGFSGDGTTCTLVDAEQKTYEYPLAKCVQCMNCICNEHQCAAIPDGNKFFDLTLDENANLLSGTYDGTSIRLNRVE